MLISDSYVWILRNAVDLRQLCVCYGKYWCFMTVNMCVLPANQVIFLTVMWVLRQNTLYSWQLCEFYGITRYIPDSYVSFTAKQVIFLTVMCVLRHNTLYSWQLCEFYGITSYIPDSYVCFTAKHVIFLTVMCF